jgi:isopentenyl phosphate kinase
LLKTPWNKLELKQKSILFKIGGSVITKKNKILTPNIKVITRIASEISLAQVSSIIIVLGGGSFGHPIAKSYKLLSGYLNESQLIGFSKTHDAMITLNRLVTKALLNQGIPAFGMSPSSFVVTKKGRINKFEK